MVAYIPSNLNIDDLLDLHPPQIKSFKKDFLVYIIGLIYNSIYYKKKQLETGEFVPLSSKILQTFRHDYKRYIDYLIANRILMNDRKYKVDKKCLGYFLEKKYRVEATEFILTDKNLIKKLKAKRLKNESKVAKQAPFLKHWFDKNDLVIDKIAAEKILPEKYEHKLNEKYIWKPSAKLWLTKIEKADLGLLNWKRSIIDLDKKNYFLKIDDRAGRLHTNLTTLSGDFRSFLTFEGRNLVNVDLSNSQPYFSLLLLKPEFWEQKIFSKIPKKAALRLIQKSKIKVAQTNPLSDRLHYLKILPQIKSSIKHTIYYDILMLVKSNKIQSGKEFQLYRDLVKKGELYDYFILQYEKHFNKKINRNTAKEIVFGILFSENVFYIPAAHPSTQFFYKLFPTIADLFFKIKVKYHNTLSLLLQNLESQSLIHHVCATISKKYPEVPLFTIHDSIATTEGNEFLVAKIMDSVLKEITGSAPMLKIEYWKTGEKIDYKRVKPLQDFSFNKQTILSNSNNAYLYV